MLVSARELSSTKAHHRQEGTPTTMADGSGWIDIHGHFDLENVVL
jgi:hypothetical protein